MTELFEPKPGKAKITATDIKAAMRKTWAAPEYAILWEVAPQTGFSNRPRYADAMIMSLWPSRGLELHGVEIKVSRSDWKREAADPSKAEALAAFCDRWWLHVAPGVIHDLAEVPATWGVREFDGKRWKTLREASVTPAQPCDRAFLASLMRRAHTGAEVAAQALAAEALTTERAAIAKQIEEGIKEAAGRRTAAESIVADLEAELGLTFKQNRYGGWSGADPREVGALIKVITETGILNGWRGLAGLAQVMQQQGDTFHKGADALLEGAQTHAGPYLEAFAGIKEREKRGKKPG